MEVDLSLQEAIEAHRRLLTQHLDIWKQTQIAHTKDSQTTSIAKEFQDRTEQMIYQCSTINLHKPKNETNGTHDVPNRKHKRFEDTADQPRSKRARSSSETGENEAAGSSAAPPPKRVPVTKDPSGLFQIDSNPGDVDVLMRQSEELKQNQGKPKQKQKRKLQPEAEEADIPPEVEVSERVVSNGKRRKAKHAEIAQDLNNEAEEHQDSFERKVALRLKEKEEQRTKNANKKRKRESEISIDAPEGAVENEPKKPAKKKGKKQPAAAAAAEDRAVNPTKFPQDAKQKNGNNAKAASSTDAPQQKPKRKRARRSA